MSRHLLRPISKCNLSPLRARQLRGLSTAKTNRVRLIEVGPRDGLQNEKTVIPLKTKIELIERLAQTGLRDIEAGSFVSPKWVPQMAASSEILTHIQNHPPQSDNPVSYAFLAPNTKGLENALSTLDASPQNPDSNHKIELAVFAAATESFTQKNLNCSIAESLQKFESVIKGGKAAGLRVRAYISVVLGCPFEGYDVDPKKVAEIACDLMEMGADEIALGDTTGMGTAPRTRDLLKSMQAAGILNEDIAMHFHDTYGQALVNTAISLEHGIRNFDSSVGGLGGCPYSPGATGNVSTEDMVYFMESLGMDTGVDLDAVVAVGDWITREIGKANSSSVGKAMLGRRKAE
ncbi:Aldolase [Glarea lozoyensis ATCC 20868]|uniref:hydroxymethylglutaryl-CoA lyase n=1 Tax=Glarea lozoyensis (strain ATCC 20868 / MF5171) TaxID=1116229 RepID=S3DVT8_GLAL2|nr:Aldolase [Glarea lozoyensis ATCC 20868]EPE30508.1 Aldolase [Glarea lozoyensis ATCC 20868]